MGLFGFCGRQSAYNKNKPKVKTSFIARERLKLVLIHDRSDTSPQILDMLKSDIIKVIQKYLEINMDELDIQITETASDRDPSIFVPALIANIPIIRVRKPERAGAERTVYK